MKEMIIGGPSIVEALKNPLRSDFEIIATDESLINFKKKFQKDNVTLDSVKITLVSVHQVQERGRKVIEEQGGQFNRIPSNMFLLTSPLPIYDLNWFYQFVEGRESCRILCLDQVSDIHNGAAILRTAAFYGVDAIVFSRKGNFALNPHFFRLASGGAEWVNVVQCGNLSRLIGKLTDMGVTCVGLSEHANENFESEDTNQAKHKLALIMGAEETGLSHAVLRMVNKQISLSSQGKISSLNVSVAAAIAMEKVWGKTL